MTIAVCRCPCGHTFTTRVMAEGDEGDGYSIEVEEPHCPACGDDNTEILEVQYDDPEPY